MAGMRSQPQGVIRLNRSNPLTRGLIAAYVPRSGPRDATGTLATLVDVAPVASPFGYATPPLTTGPYPVVGTFPVVRSDSFSAFVLGRFAISSDANGAPVVSVGQTGGTNGWKFGPAGSGGNLILTFINVADYTTAVPFPVSGGVGFSATPGSNARIFTNGAFKQQLAVSQLSVNLTTARMGIGQRGDGNLESTSASQVALALYWNRALSDAEHASVAANPYQLFDDQVGEDELSPTASVSGATATPSGVSATASVGSVSAFAGAQAAPAGVSAGGGVGVVVGSAAASASPAGIAALASVGTVTASAGARAAPLGAGAVGQVGSPAASGGAAAAPSGVSASASVGAATATGGSASTAFPAGVTASASVGTPVASAGATAAPTGMGALAQVGTATATGGSASTAAPAGVSATASVGQASASGGASAAPQGVTASASVGTVSASAGSSIPGTATPAGVGASASVGTAAGSGGAGCSPAGVAAFASVGAVIAAGEIRIPGTAYPVGVTAYARVGTVTATGGGVFARAPAGNGYSPRRIETQSRPASIQRNNR